MQPRKLLKQATANLCTFSIHLYAATYSRNDQTMPRCPQSYLMSDVWSPTFNPSNYSRLGCVTNTKWCSKRVIMTSFNLASNQSSCSHLRYVALRETRVASTQTKHTKMCFRSPQIEVFRLRCNSCSPTLWRPRKTLELLSSPS